MPAPLPRLGKSLADLRRCLSRVVARIPSRPTRFRLIRATGLVSYSFRIRRLSPVSSGIVFFLSHARSHVGVSFLEDYSTNLSAAITSSNGSGRSTGSSGSRTTGGSSNDSEVAQRNLTLESSPVGNVPGDNDVPSFAKPIGNVTAACRGEAVLSCTIRGLGNYKVAWLRAEDQTILSVDQRTVTNSQRFSVTVENARSRNQSFLAITALAGNHNGNGNGNGNNNEQQDASTGTEESTWRLHIRSLKEADRGCYMCQLNTKPMLSQLGCVDVLVGPDILVDGTSEGEVAVTEGENATLTCNASGRPQPQVHWRTEKNNFILTRGIHEQLVRVNNSSGERLELIRVDRRQTGAYLCIAKNEVPPAVSKRVYLRVNFSPSAKVGNELLSSPLHTDVSLICEIEASPKTINLWTRGKEVIMSGERYVIDERTHPDDEWKTTIELKIRNLQKTDLGEYNCSASSSMGKAESFVGLYEIERATTPPHRATSMSSKKINRGRSRSSWITTPKNNYHRASTPTVQTTSGLLTSRRKHVRPTTTTTTLAPRVPLNKDKNAFKHNEVLNVRNTGMSTVDGRIVEIILASLYSTAVFSLTV